MLQLKEFSILFEKVVLGELEKINAFF